MVVVVVVHSSSSSSSSSSLSSSSWHRVNVPGVLLGSPLEAGQLPATCGSTVTTKDSTEVTTPGSDVSIQNDDPHCQSGPPPSPTKVTPHPVRPLQTREGGNGNKISEQKLHTSNETSKGAVSDPSHPSVEPRLCGVIPQDPLPKPLRLYHHYQGVAK